MNEVRRTPDADQDAARHLFGLRLHNAVDESRLAIGMVVPVVLLVYVMLWHSVDHWRLGAWGLALGLAYAARIAFNIAYRMRSARPAAPDWRRWAAVLYVLLGVSSLAWGLLYWLVVPVQSVELHVSAAAVLMAVAGVSLGALHTLPLGYAIFTAGLLLPTAVSLLLFERSPNFLLAITLMGYWVVLVLLARNSSGIFARRALAQLAQARALALNRALLALRQREFPDFASLLREASETAARTLNVGRVGVWRFEPGRSGIVCVELFRAAGNAHEQGARLEVQAHPRYLAALESGDVIAADDACADPRTSEFGDGYLRPLGIGALLDAPLRLGTRLEGVLRFEQLGAPRRWRREEQDFAVALAGHLMHAIDQQARLEADTRFRDFSLASADMFYEADGKGRINWVAESTTRILGLPRDSILGRRIQDLAEVGHATRGETAATYLAAWRSQAPFRGLRFKLVGPRRIWFSVSGTPMFGADGGFMGYRGTVADITHEVQADIALRESERRMAALLAHLPGEAYRCRNDPAWTVEFASQGIFDLTGLPPDAFTSGQFAFADLIHLEDRERVWSLTQQALQRREPFALEYRMHSVDGAEKWVMERGAGVYGNDGALEAIEGFIIDTTEFKRASEALRRQSERLEIAQRAARMIVLDWDIEPDRL